MSEYSAEEFLVGDWAFVKASEVQCVWKRNGTTLVMSVPPKGQNTFPHFEVEIASGTKFSCEFFWWSYLTLYSLLFMQCISEYGLDHFKEVFKTISEKYSTPPYVERSSEDVVKAAERLLKGFPSEGS